MRNRIRGPRTPLFHKFTPGEQEYLREAEVRRFKRQVLTELSEHGMGHEPLPPDIVARLEAESEALFGSRDAVVDIRAFGKLDAANATT